jgi:4-nitrophenyl phosphatase
VLYLSSVAPLPATTPRVYVLGAAGLESELRAAGIPTAGGESEPSPAPEPAADAGAAAALAALAGVADGTALRGDVGAVLLGLDPRLTYARVAAATAYARRAGVRLLATNEDPRLPSPGGGWLPGSGAIMAGVCAAVGRRPDAVLGKPEAAMMAAVRARWPFDRARACMVGDRLESDIAFARRGELGGALLVLSGVAKEGDWKGREREEWPDAFVGGVGDLLESVRG